ncbi:hypothetical protein [Mesobacillus maritimus]|uniref:Uncharacterized protein n=1 Tax=Mesobacillus maritimus TaxID=1643336 RepID=A0ABS7K3F1_9BACI|nr:hypothetical protein [Mesobacillus maritimus]MBY0096728.1 hypothetical protein [Mesobacillus maritimus]
MKSWSTWLVALALIVVLVGGYVGYSVTEGDKKEPDTTVKDDSGKVVASNTVAEFTEEAETSKYKNVGLFIKEFHDTYNDSLGWGGIDSVKWNEQKDIATEILNVMETIQTENQALQQDLDKISSYAKEVISGKEDKDNLLKLHRFFHDLDIEFNGYGDTKDYYNITTYKSGS